jgi:hypothetical protein
MSLVQKVLIVEDCESKQETVGFISEDSENAIVITALNPLFSFEKPFIQIKVLKNKDDFLRLTQYHDSDILIMNCVDLISKISELNLATVESVKKMPEGYQKTVQMAQCVINYAINNKIMIANIDSIYDALGKLL